MRTVLLASMRTYARRYVAALVAIVIACGFVVGINALGAAAREGTRAVVEEQYRGADVVVSGLGDPVAYVDAVTAARADPDVTATAINWNGYTDVSWPDGSRADGIASIAEAPSLRWQSASSGRLPSAKDEAAVSARSAAKHGLRLGDSLSVDVGGTDRTFRVTGLVDDRDGPLDAAVYFPEAASADLTQIVFPHDAIVAVRADSADAVVQTLADTTPGVVSTGDQYRLDQNLQATRGVDVFQKLVLVFAAISIFVAGLVIANTFTIMLAQRSRDLALLRCVGAESRQVGRAVVAEAAMIGLVGGLLGIALGYGLAALGVALLPHWFDGVLMGTPSISASAVLWSAVLGIGLTVVASYAPARRAGASSPLAALQPVSATVVRSRAGAARVTTAAAMIAVGSLGLVSSGGGGLMVGVLGGMVSFVGVLLLMPVLVPAAIRLVGRLVRRTGAPGALAVANAIRNPRRTAATSTALLVGVTLITVVVAGAASLRSKVDTSLDTGQPVDMIVSSSRGALPASVVDQVATVDGVAAARQVTGIDTVVAGVETTVLGVDAKTVALSRDDTELAAIADGQILVPYEASALQDVSREVPAAVGPGSTLLEIHGVLGVGADPLVTSRTLATLGGDPSVRAVWVRASAGANAADVESAVTAIAERSGLEVVAGLSERADVVKALDAVLAVTVGLLAIAVLIALVGVGNTMSLSVLERIRENSLLRAMGLQRRGLRAMLAMEAMLMSTVAAALGVALGLVYAYFGIDTISVGVFTTSPTLTIPWLQLLLIVAVGAAAGLLASVLPARRAARIVPAAGLVAD